MNASAEDNRLQQHAERKEPPISSRKGIVGNDKEQGPTDSTISIRDNDVLNGRGVSVASHAGNKRFRKLVSSHYDANYCSTYKTTEKRAVADKIITHIKGLDPPGRFLKRSGRNRLVQGLEGLWEEMPYLDALKKTTQALRDANRDDRSGYAVAIPAPEDVKQHIDLITQEGLTKQQFAKRAAAEIAAKTETLALPATGQRTRERHEELPRLEDTTSLSFSPPTFSNTETTEWMKRPRLESVSLAPLPSVTPSTAVRPGSLFDDEEDGKMPARHHFFHADAMTTDDHHHDVFHDSQLPVDDSGEENYEAAFKRTARDPLDDMAAHAAAGLDETSDYPSPFHDDDVELSAEHAFD